MSECDHDLLMARLRAIATEVDPQPAMLDEMARATFSTRRLEGELAELVMDSALVMPALVSDVEDGIRLLSLGTATVLVELQLERENGAITIRGFVSGASGEMIVETIADRQRIEIDEQGLFTVRGMPPALRLRLRGEDGIPVTTSWISA